jgi:lipopolysaccharide export system permease protein
MAGPPARSKEDHLNRPAQGPRILRLLVLRQSLVRFAGGEALLLGIMILADLFSSMWRFLAAEASFGGILLWILAGMPAHLLEVLPVAYLFGITLSLAEMHADGELLVIWGSGISIQSLAKPILLFSFVLAFAMFMANDLVGIPAANSREELSKTLAGQRNVTRQLSEVTILDDGGRYVYHAAYYDPAQKRLGQIDIVARNEAGMPFMRILAPSAQWNNHRWEFRDARIYTKATGGEWTERREGSYSDDTLDAGPESFEVFRAKPGNMKSGELYRYIQRLETSGLPVAEAKTEWHKRFSNAFTPLIVCGLSVAFAGLFRKNSLLLSLLFSLGTATVYYVAQMLGALSAKTGWVSPAAGIWSATLLFLAIAVFGFARAKT